MAHRLFTQPFFFTMHMNCIENMYWLIGYIIFPRVLIFNIENLTISFSQPLLAEAIRDPKTH